MLEPLRQLYSIPCVGYARTTAPVILRFHCVGYARTTVPVILNSLCGYARTALLKPVILDSLRGVCSNHCTSYTRFTAWGMLELLQPVLLDSQWGMLEKLRQSYSIHCVRYATKTAPVILDSLCGVCSNQCASFTRSSSHTRFNGWGILEPLYQFYSIARVILIPCVGMLEPLLQLYPIPCVGCAQTTAAIILDSQHEGCSNHCTSYTRFTAWVMQKHCDSYTRFPAGVMLEPLRQLYSIPCVGNAQITGPVILDSLRGVCSNHCAIYTRFPAWGMLKKLQRLYTIVCLGYARSTAPVILNLLCGVFSIHCASYTQFTVRGMLDPLRQLYSIPEMGYARTTATVVLDSLLGVFSYHWAPCTRFPA